MIKTNAFENIQRGEGKQNW